MTKHDERAKVEAHIANIIARETGWTVGWYVDEDQREAMYAKTAKKIMRYLAERSKREGR